MNYLIFDQSAIATFVSKSVLQSIEYTQGMHLVNHICHRYSSEIFEDVAIEYCDDGIFFSGLRSQSQKPEHYLFCIDLTQCELMKDKEDMASMLTIIQKCFRTVLKIWNRQPFSSSERINGTKSIVFPFTYTDHRRIVIERSNTLRRLAARNVEKPLLAYKYTCDDPHGEDVVNTDILEKACEEYVRLFPNLQNKIKAASQSSHTNSDIESAISLVSCASSAHMKNDFIYRGYNLQYQELTTSQKKVVDFASLSSPLRIDGAAGTGKTLSLIMRAYRILLQKREEHEAFTIAFFSHSESTCNRVQQIFESYEYGVDFLCPESPQRIIFSSLYSYCVKLSRIPSTSLLENDAGDSKTYQLMLIESVYGQAKETKIIKTYFPLLSSQFRNLFSEQTPTNVICSLLQHEFGVQIKGRTDCTFDSYSELPSIKNGLPCTSKEEKELVFRLFNLYQDELNSSNSYDVDDITLEALSRLNAPVWRRERHEKGYDYIIVDEMHLFSINEQSVFHYLTKDTSLKEIPICFALDYSQAIGDRGNTDFDYIKKSFGTVTQNQYNTVFRNSPQIANFCAGIAASGTLMFQTDFRNPYSNTQNVFTDSEELKSNIPVLYMCRDDDVMISRLGICLDSLVRTLQCKRKEIAIISFVPDWATPAGASILTEKTGKKIAFVDNKTSASDSDFLLLSPYSVNGMEFHAVVLLGVDEGRIPQTAGVSDISQHFTRYSSYNLLYLSSSRAKYQLLLLSNSTNGKSSCLDHVLEAGYLDLKEEY